MEGVSLSANGLRVDGARTCPGDEQRGGHRLNEVVLEQARRTGAAEGWCEQCGAMIRVVRA